LDEAKRHNIKCLNVELIGRLDSMAKGQLHENCIKKVLSIANLLWNRYRRYEPIFAQVLSDIVKLGKAVDELWTLKRTTTIATRETSLLNKLSR